MQKFISGATKLGFSKAVLLKDLSLKCKEELRAFCNPQQCLNHGQNWVCPPGCGSLEACRKKVQNFNEGILIQSISRLTPPTELEEYQELNRQHNCRFRKYIETIKPEFAEILPLTSGGCVFCEQCSFPAQCIKPELKMESLSAFGIDVGSLCELAGLPFSFRDDILYLTSLLLFKTA